MIKAGASSFGDQPPLFLRRALATFHRLAQRIAVVQPHFLRYHAIVNMDCGLHMPICGWVATSGLRASAASRACENRRPIVALTCATSLA